MTTFLSAGLLIAAATLQSFGSLRREQGTIHFDLVKFMGRAEQELDFVLFLDGEPASGDVRDATEEDFIASADRPSTFSR